MASSSTSSIQRSFKYDVFMSFRGEDTRKTFVDHLYHALKLKNIESYKDDENLEKGKKVGKELIEAIQDSRFHIIIFSKNYASSSWCLDELIKIMECQNTHTGQTVYPIFYDVEPTEVRNQSGVFGEAFAKHKNKEDAGKWGKALKDASCFSGWDLRTTADGHEAEFIKIVVEEISLKLPSINAEDSLIGMRTRINDVVSSLNSFPDVFCMIGITGMGGIGKTTLARALFDQICNEFEGSSFVENVREVSKSIPLGLKWLQQQILRDVINDQGIIVNGVFEGKKMMKKNLPYRRVLIVLDDVDHIDQLKALAGKPSWFMKGSRIVITTRDKQVLIAHKVNLIHDVKFLTDAEAICLLSRCAFGTESPILGYEELSRKVVSYAAGLPLTITILASSLCDDNKHIWTDTLRKLEKIPLDGTLQKLELSYMGLDTDCKEIFLDVACILKGWKEDEAIRVLESRGFHAIRGLSVLEKKSLITISRDGCLDMHNHIEEMGKYIVRRSNLDEPRRHTRLWIGEEINDILAKDLVNEATTCIYLQMLEINREIVMKGLRNMEKLRLLLVYGNDFNSCTEFDAVGQYLPNSLQYLAWSHYSFCYLPKKFQASNLVGLEMPFSNMVQLWEGGERKVLHKLRFLELAFSYLRTLDLELTPNLEVLDLQCCYHLIELNIPGCPKLKSLNLNGSKLSTLDLWLASNIETLNLEGCNNLVELKMPRECSQLKSLKLSSLKLRSLNLGLTPNIETLSLKECKDLVELGMSSECPQLKSLNLNCLNLRSFNLWPNSNIETPKLGKHDYMVELGMFLEYPQLESIDLRISMLRTLDLGSTSNLKTLKLLGCNSLGELHMHDEQFKLKTLCLGCPQLRAFDLGLNLNLKALTLDGHNDFVGTLIFVGCPKLKYLRLINSKLRTLELTLNLKTLILEYCGLVELRIPGDVKLKSLDIKKCLELKTLDLRQTPKLENLCLEECSSLVKLHVPRGGLKNLIHLKAQGFLRFTKFRIVCTSGSLPELDLHGKLVDICRLHQDNHFPKFQFKCFYREHLPSLIGNVEKLISEGFSCACTDLERFFGGICGLQYLTKLTLKGDLLEVPKELERLQCLQELTLKSTKIKHLPDSICMLKHLKVLKLEECKLLEKLPQDLGRLECLETLVLEECIVLQDIPKSIYRMKCLRYFDLSYCKAIKELPEELGHLICLKYLILQGTCINNLPRSIFLLEGLKIRPKDAIPTTSTTGCCPVL